MTRARHQKWIASVALGAAVTIGLRASTARAADVLYNGLGDGTSWNDPNNWMNEDTMTPALPGLGDLALINGTFTVNVSGAHNIGSFAVGHGEGVARLNILPGAEFTVNNTSRVGRGANSVGGARGEVIQTGGTVLFTGSRRLGLTFDSRSLPEVNADSLYAISGGTLQLDGTGSIQIGRETGSSGPISFDRAEFRVVGSGASLIEANRLSLDAGGQQGTPVLSFVIDSGGVTPITLRDDLRLNNGATLEIGVMSDTVPTGEITLVNADRFSGTLTEFVGRPDMSPISAIHNGRLFEWTLQYIDMLDDGIIDSSLKLIDPRSFRGGDANKDGLVNLSDFNTLAANFGTDGHDWTGADFNGDGNVNLSDFNTLAANFGLGALASDPTPQDWSTLAAAVVPEPGMIGLAALTALPLLRRRRIP